MSEHPINSKTDSEQEGEPLSLDFLVRRHVQLGRKIESHERLNRPPDTIAQLSEQQHEIHEAIAASVGNRSLATHLIHLEDARRKADSISEGVSELIGQKTGCYFPVYHR